MKKEAKENAKKDENIKKEIEKLNAADNQIFQSERQLKDYENKLSENNKKNIEDSLEKLKLAHSKKDFVSIDNYMKKLNEAWTNASQEIYNIKNTNKSNESNKKEDEKKRRNSKGNENIQDVDYEEVK